MTYHSKRPAWFNDPRSVGSCDTESGRERELFSVIFSEVFGHELLLKVTYETDGCSPASLVRKREETADGWRGSFTRAEYSAGHPWRTINLARKMVDRMRGWSCAWKYARHWYDNAQIWNALKIASNERAWLDPSREFPLT